MKPHIKAAYEAGQLQALKDMSIKAKFDLDTIRKGLEKVRGIDKYALQVFEEGGHVVVSIPDYDNMNVATDYMESIGWEYVKDEVFEDDGESEWMEDSGSHYESDEDEEYYGDEEEPEPFRNIYFKPINK